MSRTLTRQQVLTWRDSWSVSDRKVVADALAVLPADTVFYETTSYAAARVQGRVAVYISPGYLSWPGGQWVPTLDDALLSQPLEDDGMYVWGALSTFRPHSGAKPTSETFDAACPDCFMVPARNGACSCE